ncbi:hypothetical protein RhiirA1_484938 [Rhizophagus irregularis]|uniref:Uncharacterized protein n=1 Tax=Rhizophagus irregularis TaxID=588596 RepID=A0A2N0QIS5_9GLOM|nr:hypothetical protein RhiirA1_484938 [Rhizophagus irregularis]
MDNAVTIIALVPNCIPDSITVFPNSLAPCMNPQANTTFPKKLSGRYVDSMGNKANTIAPNRIEPITSNFNGTPHFELECYIDSIGKIGDFK